MVLHKLIKKEVFKMTREELFAINPTVRGLTKDDINKANFYISFLEKTRNENAPQTGDIVEYTTSYGKTYKNAHIDNQNNPDSFAVCMNAYTPFITDIKNGLKLSTSGGTWESAKIGKFQYVGKRKKMFCFWGSLGWVADGAINIEATVNVWRYIEE